MSDIHNASQCCPLKNFFLFILPLFLAWYQIIHQKKKYCHVLHATFGLWCLDIPENLMDRWWPQKASSKIKLSILLFFFCGFSNAWQSCILYLLQDNLTAIMLMFERRYDVHSVWRFFYTSTGKCTCVQIDWDLRFLSS